MGKHAGYGFFGQIIRSAPRFEGELVQLGFLQGKSRSARRPNERERVGRRAFYGIRKGTLLESVPLGVTTWTVPVVAPFGTVVVISELETTSKTAPVPLKVTLVAPVRFVPRILTGRSHLTGSRQRFNKRS